MKEIIWIRKTKDNMNTDEGWYQLSHIYAGSGGHTSDYQVSLWDDYCVNFYQEPLRKPAKNSQHVTRENGKLV